MYEVAPEAELQLAKNEEFVNEEAAEAVGIDGILLTVNEPELVAVPPAVVTEIVPVVPAPTVAVIEVALFTV